MRRYHATRKSFTTQAGAAVARVAPGADPATRLIAAPIPVPALDIGAAIVATVGDQTNRRGDHQDDEGIGDNQTLGHTLLQSGGSNARVGEMGAIGSLSDVAAKAARHYGESSLRIRLGH